MNSRDYWKKREDEARKNTIRDEKEYNARLNEIYQYMISNIERQVNDWYARYASKEGITMAEARGRVKHIDMERYERLAAKYVATHDFSEQANQEMALYNLTMKVNRLELLKAEINLELMAGFDDIEHEMRRDLIETAMKEDRRLAGILGDSVIGNEEYAKQLVNASFRNATFSERIWGRNMPDLRVHLEAELRNGLVQGIGSVELARRFRKHYGGSVKDTERLMATEMCRLQTAVQKDSFERNGYKEYMFITSGNDNVCPDCEALHGQHFKVSEMQAGVNAPPMHPRCHCSVAGYMDSDKYKRWIDALANGEDVRWNEFEADEDKITINSGREQYYKSSVKDEADNIKTTNYTKVTASRAKEYSEKYYIADNIEVKPKQLHEIHKNMERAMRLHGIDKSPNRPAIVIVGDTEMSSNALAAYSAVDNTIKVYSGLGIRKLQKELVKGVAEEENPISTFVHELFHWKDAQKYIEKNGPITEANRLDYLQTVNEEAKRFVEKLRNKGYDITSISEYATNSLKKRNFDEVRTEYRTKVLLNV